jgi:hypothetical protein
MDEARVKELLEMIEVEARARGASNQADIDRIKRAFEKNFGWSFNNPHAAIDEENIRRLVEWELKQS